MPKNTDKNYEMSRRHLLTGAVAVTAPGAFPGNSPQLNVELQSMHPDQLDYLTKDADFGTVERGNPIPYHQPEAKLREIGMTRETWSMDIVPDLATGTKMDLPLAKSSGNAFSFADLMKLSETKSVRYLKVVSCNNLASPLGMGLWEGVPLRDVIWRSKPVSDIRRVIYYGHHNEDPKQIFKGSLPLGRILEDPPGHNPVMLAYKMNGEWLSGRRGGPVRMIVPEAYGFKSVKWIQRIVLTNLMGANDTYADENNDIDSWMKTCARFMSYPEKCSSKDSIKVTGVAQIGISGLSRVQYWLQNSANPAAVNDPHYTKAPWKDALIMNIPKNWGGGLPHGQLPKDVIGFNAAGVPNPSDWPARYSILHWSAMIERVPAGKYTLRCRTIDANGYAQPMPRPLPKSGINTIQEVEILVR